MAPSTPTLLGPPEIYTQPTAASDSSPADTVSTSTTGDPLMDFILRVVPNAPPESLDCLVQIMAESFNEKNPPTATGLTDNDDKPFKPAYENLIPLGLTQNFSLTFLSTGNPCLDFFFHVVPDTPPETLNRRLQLAWDQDPLKAIKLVCNLRGVRGTGKSDKEGYYTAALWLHKHHPKTLACNVASLAYFGYFKDLPEILFRLLEGPDVRKLAKEMSEMRKMRKHFKRLGVRRRSRMIRGRGTTVNKIEKKKIEKPKKSKRIEKKPKKLTRKEKRIEKAKRAVERFNSDPDYKLLHDRVSEFFAQCLRSDIMLLNSGGPYKLISLAAKWCPSLDSSFDQATLLCETIAKKVFPREECPEYQGIEDAHYAYRARDRLRKEVLVPLRKALELPEVYMGANDWGSIPYNRVASVAMKLYKEKFLKHDKERFEEYLEKVMSRKAKIAAGGLFPHEIIAALNDSDGGQVAELQWRRMVEDMAKKGKLNNCLAICDVSGSMGGIPMEVSVALGVLVSELSEEPWKGKLITFSQDPELQIVEGDSLREKTEFVRRMEWGMNTDFQKVFDLLLQVAMNGNLRPDQMIKRLFVFSDMEFDQASANPWETDYQAIVRKFGERGYGDCVPEIVFWNLRDSKATPVPGNQKGVALVSGFSKNLMTLFMEDGGGLSPDDVMEAAISGDEYQKLAVLD